MSLIINFVRLTLILGSLLAVKLPPAFKRCEVSPKLDGKPNKCLKASISDAIRTLCIDGSRELNVARLDPLKIREVKIEQGESSPIAIRLQFKNSDLTGIKDIIIDEINGNISSPNGFHMQAFGRTRKLELNGPYSVTGQVLILPIQGAGQSRLSFLNLNAKVDIFGESEIRRGVEYLKIKSLHLDITHVDKMEMFLENLFNGEEEMGGNMNRFLNENWRDIYAELEATIEKAFSDVFESYSKRIMERVPFRDLFIVK